MDVLYVMLRPKLDGLVYGGEKSTIITARGVAERGGRATFLVTSADAITGELESAGLPYEVVPVCDPLLGIRSAPLADKLRRLKQLAQINLRVFRLARSGRANIVHVYGVPAVVATWAGAKLGGAALIFHLRDISSAGRTRWYEEAAILLADRTVAISVSLRDSLLKTASAAIRGVLSPRIVAVYNAFEFRTMDEFIARYDRATCRVAVGMTTGALVGVLVGAVGEKKGQLRVIEEILPAVVARVPGFRMVFLGGLDDRAYVERCRAAAAARALGDAVWFAGYQPQTEVYRWLRAAELAVVASAREGLSRFAVEAHAFGLPVVSFRIPGPVDVVDDGVTGYLVDEAAPSLMVERIVELCENAALRGRMGRAAAAHVRAKFILERHHDEIAGIYADVTS